MPLLDGLAVYKEQTDFGNDKISERGSDKHSRFMQEPSSYIGNGNFEKIIRKNYEIYTLGAKIILTLCATGLGLSSDYFKVLYSSLQ